MSGWLECESRDAAVREFNRIMSQMEVSGDILWIENYCAIPFSFIKQLSDRTGSKGRFLVIDGLQGHALTMFNINDTPDLDGLRETITAILFKEIDNQMISLVG